MNKLEREHRRCKVYASCLEALRKLSTCCFSLRGYRDKNTIRRCIQGSKTRNNLQKRYLQITKEEAAYLRVTNIQLKMQETLIPVMSLENQTSQVRYG